MRKNVVLAVLGLAAVSLGVVAAWQHGRLRDLRAAVEAIGAAPGAVAAIPAPSPGAASPAGRAATRRRRRRGCSSCRPVWCATGC
jgi:hypothetical protein